MVSPGLASKTVVMISPGLASKSVALVFRFGPQNWQLRFGDLSIKITTTVSWFESQNQADYGFLFAPQNRREDDSTRGTCQDLVACFA
jgi:hypothetical protein